MSMSFERLDFQFKILSLRSSFVPSLVFCRCRGDQFLKKRGGTRGIRVHEAKANNVYVDISLNQNLK